MNKVVQPQSISRTSSQTETPSPLNNNTHLGSFQIRSGPHPRPTEAGPLGEGPRSSIFKNSYPQCWSWNKEGPTQVGLQILNFFGHLDSQNILRRQRMKGMDPIVIKSGTWTWLPAPPDPPAWTLGSFGTSFSVFLKRVYCCCSLITEATFALERKIRIYR